MRTTAQQNLVVVRTIAKQEKLLVFILACIVPQETDHISTFDAPPRWACQNDSSIYVMACIAHLKLSLNFKYQSTNIAKHMLEKKLADVAKHMVCEKPVLVFFRIASGCMCFYLFTSAQAEANRFPCICPHVCLEPLGTWADVNRCIQRPMQQKQTKRYLR